MKAQENYIGSTFIVLMDFSEASYNALKYVITIAKTVKGNIKIIHCADMREILDKHNALACKNYIGDETVKIKAKLNSIVEIISEEKIHVSSEYFFGKFNLKIGDYLKAFPKDIVVIGGEKTMRNPVNNKLHFLLNNHPGPIMIVGAEAKFHDDINISFACKASSGINLNEDFVIDLAKHASSSSTLLYVSTPNDSQATETLLSVSKGFQESGLNIHLESAKSNSVAKGIAEHISETNTELLCLGRRKRRNILQYFFINQHSTLSEIIKKINIPILILGVNS